MRYGVIACSLLALSLTLSGCNSSSSSSPSGLTAENARWTDATAKQLRAAIDSRAAHGLDRMRFEMPEDTSDQAALTQSALRYASALARGASDPAKLSDIYSVPRPNPNLKNGLAEALARGRVDDWLGSLVPQDDNYRALSKAYRVLRKANEVPATAIPDAGKPLDPGERDARVPAIARQLVASGYLDAGAAQGETYSPDMVKAVSGCRPIMASRPTA